jgi:hypothetical protein
VRGRPIGGFSASASYRDLDDGVLAPLRLVCALSPSRARPPKLVGVEQVISLLSSTVVDGSGCAGCGGGGEVAGKAQDLPAQDTSLLSWRRKRDDGPGGLPSSGIKTVESWATGDRRKLVDREAGHRSVSCARSLSKAGPGAFPDFSSGRQRFSSGAPARARTTFS